MQAYVLCIKSRYLIYFFNIHSLFGGLMFLSLFEFNVIKENLFILKSTKGKGVFCLL